MLTDLLFKHFLSFMELEGLLPCLQKSALGGQYYPD